MAQRLSRRDIELSLSVPWVSFTFDDAPRTAFRVAGPMLLEHGARATYYLSLGLLGTTSELGLIGDRNDLERALAEGHDLGCHTFDHVDAWTCTRKAYLSSVDRNREALSTWYPGQQFKSFAYPKSGATFSVKRELEQRFYGCRGGGQTFNVQGVIDLNLLKACFIDQRTGFDLAAAEALVQANALQRGWLILAAHAIADDAGSAFACAPKLIESLLRLCADSGSRVLSVAAALAELRPERKVPRF